MSDLASPVEQQTQEAPSRGVRTPSEQIIRQLCDVIRQRDRLLADLDRAVTQQMQEMLETLARRDQTIADLVRQLEQYRNPEGRWQG